MESIISLMARIAAVFGSSALAAIAGGAVFGVELWKSAAIAGVMSAARVLESLMSAYAEDGVLDKSEISEAFGGTPKPGKSSK
jgi:hypothetical protein